MRIEVPKYKMIFCLKMKIRRFLIFCLVPLWWMLSLSAVGQSIEMNQKVDNWRALLAKGAFQTIIDSCNAALQMERFTADKVVLSDVLSLQATALRQLDELDLAIQQHKNALAIRMQFLGVNTAKTASSYLNLGNCYWEKTEYERAFPYFKKALAIKEQLFGKNAFELVNVYNSLANYYVLQNDFPNATKTIKKVLAIAALHDQTKSPSLISTYLIYANLQLKQQQHLDSALIHLRQALQIQQDSSVFLHPTTAAIYKSMGNALYAKGAYWTAIDTLEKAAQIYQSIGRLEGKDLADCQINIGNCYANLGDALQAIVHYNQASFFIGDEEVGQLEIANNLGLAYKYANQLPKAIATFRKAINTYINLPVKTSNQQLLLADIYLNLGTCYLKEKRIGGAIYYFEEGLKLHQALQSPLLKIAQIKNQLGIAKLRNGETEEAANLLQTNLVLATELANPIFTFSTNYYLGQLYEKENEYDLSLTHYQQALTAIMPRNEAALIFPFERIQIYSTIANLYLQQDRGVKANLLNALDFAEKGIQVLTALKGDLTSTKSEVSLQNTFYHLYNTAIESTLLLAKYDKDFEAKAFQLTNQYKGNLLKKISRQASAQSTFRLPDSLLQQAAIIEATLNTYQQQQFYESQQQELLGSTYQATVTDSLIAVLQVQKKEYLHYLKDNYTDYYQLIHEEKEINIKDIQAKLSAEQTLIEYQWGTDQIWVFVFTKDTFSVNTIPYARKLTSDIQRINTLYTQRSDLLPKVARDTIFNELVLLAQDLYQQLIQPIAKKLQKELIIVPDGLLCYVPFELLIEQPAAKNRYFRSHQYLIQKHAISYQYASSLLVNQERNNLLNNSQKLLAIAPIFDKKHPILNPLKHNRKEAELIQSAIGGALWNQGKDSKTKLIQQLPSFSLLHLSTHGVLNDVAPEHSYIAFTNQSDNLFAEQLTVAEIYNLRLTTEMVVLSACKTAEGALSRGEGLLSLAHAFTYAGAKSLVASLWNVDDRHTPKLMESYYKYLKAGQSKSIALQQAKKDYLATATQEEAFPFYWAAFILIGDDIPLFAEKNTNYWYYLMGILGLIFLSIVWKKLNLNNHDRQTND